MVCFLRYLNSARIFAARSHRIEEGSYGNWSLEVSKARARLSFGKTLGTSIRYQGISVHRVVGVVGRGARMVLMSGWSSLRKSRISGGLNHL